jgi:hypothetical protein
VLKGPTAELYLYLCCVCRDVKIPGCPACDVASVNLTIFVITHWLFSQVVMLAWTAYSLLAVQLFLFSKASIPALGPMGCPVQWVVGAVFLRNTVASTPPFGVKVKNVQAVLPFVMCLHAVCHGA